MGYLGKLAPEVGGGLGGLPRRKALAADTECGGGYPEPGSSVMTVASVEPLPAGYGTFSSIVSSNGKVVVLTPDINAGSVAPLYSIDGGVTFSSSLVSGAAFNEFPTKAAICCSADGQFVAYLHSPYVMVSWDFGATFVVAHANNTLISANDGSICCSADGQYIYTGFAKSADGGSTWDSIPYQYPHIDCSADGSIVCTGAASTTTSASVFVSTDFGQSFANRSFNAPGANSGPVHGIKVLANDQVVFSYSASTGAQYCIKSNDLLDTSIATFPVSGGFKTGPSSSSKKFASFTSQSNGPSVSACVSLTGSYDNFIDVGYGYNSVSIGEGVYIAGASLYRYTI